MEDFNQLKIIFDLLIRGIKYVSKHLSLVLLIPALLGGVWQIIELSQMSFSYVRFFSPSQVLADGLLILLLLIFFAGTFFFLYIIYNHYIKRSVSVYDSFDDGNPHTTTKKNNYIRFLFLFILYIILLLFEIYALSRILKKPDSFFTILILFPVAAIILYMALTSWMFANISIVSTWFYKNILRHTIWLWFGTIFVSFLLMVSSFRESFALPNDLINADIVIHQIAEANPETQPVIVYNNDKYLFIELNNFFYLHNKPVNGGMLIVPVDDIFHLSDVKYKLPEYTKAGYNFNHTMQQRQLQSGSKRNTK